MTQAHPTRVAPSSGVRCIHCGETHPLSFAHCPQTGKGITAGEALVGRVIAERYRVVDLVGQGGMGAVYAAEHTATGRKLAIKRLHPELAGDHKSVLRFQREARAAGATGHDHIVEIIDLGLAEDGAPFLAMEFLEGENLAEVLRREGRLPPTRACAILAQALDALAAVHAEGIVHRDLKPDNLFLTRRGGRGDYLKILDFGVSKVRRGAGDTFDLTLTRTGAMVGTPYYMSPEQARGASDYDHRVDLYAVGVILYQCLSGQLPYDAENYHALLQAILRGQAPDLAALAPDVPPPLCQVVHRAMAPNPATRFASAWEMQRALVPFGAPPPGKEPAPRRLSSDLGSTAPRGSVASQAPPTPPSVALPHLPAMAHVPPPRTWADRPVPYEAQSDDWDERHGTMLALSATRPTPVPRPTTAAISEAPAGTRIKGTLMTAGLEHLRNTHGARAHDALLEQLAPDERAELQGDADWIHLALYDHVLRAAERALGTGDGSIAADMGAAAAAKELWTSQPRLLEDASPSSTVGHIPAIFRSYHDGGHVRIAPGTGGAYRLTVEGLRPDTFLHAMAMTGFYRTLLELAGADEPRAWLVSSRARGDAQTITALRWR